MSTGNPSDKLSVSSDEAGTDAAMNPSAPLIERKTLTRKKTLTSKSRRHAYASSEAASSSHPRAKHHIRSGSSDSELRALKKTESSPKIDRPKLHEASPPQTEVGGPTESDVSDDETSVASRPPNFRNNAKALERLGLSGPPEETDISVRDNGSPVLSRPPTFRNNAKALERLGLSGTPVEADISPPVVNKARDEEALATSKANSKAMELLGLMGGSPVPENSPIILRTKPSENTPDSTPEAAKKRNKSPNAARRTTSLRGELDKERERNREKDKEREKERERERGTGSKKSRKADEASPPTNPFSSTLGDKQMSEVGGDYRGRPQGFLSYFDPDKDEEKKKRLRLAKRGKKTTASTSNLASLRGKAQTLSASSPVKQRSSPKSRVLEMLGLAPPEEESSDSDSYEEFVASTTHNRLSSTPDGLPAPPSLRTRGRAQSLDEGRMSSGGGSGGARRAQEQEPMGDWYYDEHGGSQRKLMRKGTMSELLDDLTFAAPNMVTTLHLFLAHRQFMSSSTLVHEFHALVSRALKRSDPTAMLVRVMGFLKQWITIDYQGLNADEEALPAMRKVLQTVEESPQGTVATVVSATLRIKGRSFKSKGEIPPPLEVPMIDLLKYPAELIAEQITLVDNFLLGYLHYDDLQDARWTKGESPAIKAAALYSNALTALLSAQIFARPGEEQFRAICHVIDIGGRLLKLHDYNAVLVVFLSLQIRRINRVLLKKKKDLPYKTLRRYERIVDMMDPVAYFKKYRSVIRVVQGPYIPCYEIHLKDILFLTDGNKDYLDEGNAKGIVNLWKLDSMGKMIAVFHIAQNQKFELTKNDEVYAVLDALRGKSPEQVQREVEDALGFVRVNKEKPTTVIIEPESAVVDDVPLSAEEDEMPPLPSPPEVVPDRSGTSSAPPDLSHKPKSPRLRSPRKSSSARKEPLAIKVTSSSDLKAREKDRSPKEGEKKEGEFDEQEGEKEKEKKGHRSRKSRDKRDKGKISEHGETQGEGGQECKEEEKKNESAVETLMKEVVVMDEVTVSSSRMDSSVLATMDALEAELKVEVVKEKVAKSLANCRKAGEEEMPRESGMGKNVTEPLGQEEERREADEDEKMRKRADKRREGSGGSTGADSTDSARICVDIGKVREKQRESEEKKKERATLKKEKTNESTRSSKSRHSKSDEPDLPEMASAHSNHSGKLSHRSGRHSDRSSSNKSPRSRRFGRMSDGAQKFSSAAGRMTPEPTPRSKLDVNVSSKEVSDAIFAALSAVPSPLLEEEHFVENGEKNASNTV